MAIEQEDVKLVKEELWPDEQVVITVRQRRVGPGGSMITPTSVVATDKRLLIVNLATLGLRKDIQSIPYSKITSVRFEHGIISSSVFVRVAGFDLSKGLAQGPPKQEGEIDGLNNKDAVVLSEYLDKIITESDPSTTPETGGSKKGAKFCPKCGEAIEQGSSFCTNCGTKL